MKDYKPVLENILKYIRCVEQIHKNHNYDREYFCSQNLSEYSLSVNMCILQIGELIKTIDDDFRKQHPFVQWRGLAGMRDITAHTYGSIDLEIVWEVSVDELPGIRLYIESSILNCSDE